MATPEPVTPNLAERLRTRSLEVAAALFTFLFGVGSLTGIPQLISGVNLPSFFAPFTVAITCFVAWLLVRNGYQRASRRLFAGTMYAYLFAMTAIAPFLLKFGLAFPMSILTVFLFHLTHPPAQASRLGAVLVGILAFGYGLQASIDVDVLLNWQVITAAIAQLLVLAFSTIMLARLGRDWMFALADADQVRSQLLEAHELATQASRAKSGFLAAMSHELRTPLNAVIGYAELVAEDTVDEPQARDLMRIQTAARHLLDLVNQVLDLSRIEAGKVQFESEAVALDMLVRQVCDILLPQLHANGNRLELRLEQVGAITLDPLRTRQIVTNLLGNAAKFTSDGTIEVRVAQVGRWQRVSVHDDGPGIPKERLEAIFSPFEQANPNVQVRYGGTGLGLAISRRLAEEMGGRLWAESEPDQGATFILAFPARRRSLASTATTSVS
ncbi:MAG: HAMP domain-containing sensor histidine kinase [Myxococcota bacterium]